MKKFYIVVMILFFFVVAGILYYSLTHQQQPHRNVPVDQQETGAFRLLDSGPASE